MPFDKKFACVTNYQERRSFPWSLVSNSWLEGFKIQSPDINFPLKRCLCYAGDEWLEVLIGTLFDIFYCMQIRSEV